MSDPKNIGLIAQEVETIYPELVQTDERGFKSVAYGNLAVLNIAATQELASVLGIEVSTSTDHAIHSLRLEGIEKRLADLEAKQVQGGGLIATVKEWVGDKLTASLGIFKKVRVEEGLEMKDKATGETYCIVIENGVMINGKGECGTPTGNSSTTTVNTTGTTSISTSTTTGITTATTATTTAATTTVPITESLSTSTTPTSTTPLETLGPVIISTPEPVSTDTPVSP
jgi:hypothetical protein